MDIQRLTEWLKTAEGLGKAIVAVIGIPALLWTAVSKLLTPLGVPTWMIYAGAAVVGVVTLSLLLLGFRRFASASRLERPEAFTLRPSEPSSLVGRTDDLEKLVSSVKRNRLILLDGESGCGKSALVFAGLIPQLEREPGGLLPIAFRDWGNDWVRGPLAAALDATFRSLSDADRERLDWKAAPDLAADTTELASVLGARLDAVFTQLGRRPILIADQFDDHQAQHRNRFLDADDNWVAPTQLAAVNAFWAVVRSRLLERRIHLLIVTRADTAAGLACIRFLDEAQTAARTLPRVDREFLRPLLATIAPPDVVPPIVSNPANGWDALRDRLEIDLQSEGAILMQQVRTVLLGLRQLPVLTPRRYRVAGGLRGVETLVILRALRRAGDAVGGGVAGIRLARALLDRMILADRDRPPKSQRASLSALSEAAQGQANAEAILAVLQQEELVRPADSVGEAHTWQLDHDYLARSAVLEARKSDRWTMALREGHARYLEATTDAKQRRAALLPFWTLLRVCWEAMRERLRFGSAARYVRISAIKPLVIATILFAVVGAAPGVYAEGRDWVYSFGLVSTLRIPAQALPTAMVIWRGSDSLRTRVYRRIEASSGGAGDPDIADQALAGPWPFAHAGVEAARALEAATLLRVALMTPAGQDRNSQALLSYEQLAWRLDDAGLLAEDSALRAAFEHASDEQVNGDLTLAYAAIGARLNQSERSRDAARTLRVRAALEPKIPDRMQIAEAYGQVIARLDQASAAEEYAALKQAVAVKEPGASDVTWMLYAKALCLPRYAGAAVEAARTVREHFDRKAPTQIFDVTADIGLYSSIAECLTPDDARAEATALREQWKDEPPGRFADRLFVAYLDSTRKLEDREALADAARLARSRMVATDVAASTELTIFGLAMAYGDLATRLDAADAAMEANALRDEAAHAHGPGVATAVAVAYASIAARLNSSADAAAAIAMLAPMFQDEPGSEGEFGDSAVQSYAAVVPFLSDADASREVTALRERWERANGGPIPLGLVAAYGSMAARLSSPGDRASAAAFLRARLEEQLPTAPHPNIVGAARPAAGRADAFRLMQAAGDAYATLAEKLDETTARSEAEAMRPGFESTNDYRVAAVWAVPYAAVVARLADAKSTEAGMALLQDRLTYEWSAAADQFARAYALLATASFARSDAAHRRSLAREIVALSGHPFITKTDDLLAALKPASSQDFHGDIAAAARWAQATYGFRSSDFRPVD